MKKELYKVGDILQDKSEDGEIIIILGYANLPAGNYYSKVRMGEGISINKKTGKVNTFRRVLRSKDENDLVQLGHINVTQLIVDMLSNISDSVYPEYKSNKLLSIDSVIEYYGE